MKKWNELSMTEKSKMMEVAVRNGITTLDGIRDAYNSFAEGGELSDQEYYTIMENVAKENWKEWEDESEDAAYLRILNDNRYNYRGYYNKYPNGKANALTHWTDEYKTVYHPSFSNQSIYSGKKSQYNPYGLEGGRWSDEEEDALFIPQAWQLLRKKYNKGGNLYSGEDTPTQQTNSGLNLYRRANKLGDVEYIYQETPDSEEIHLTPINTLLPDPAQWTFTDSEGRTYTPRKSSPTTKSVLSQSEEENPLVRAANNYFRELQYRAKNDPASIALQGKYTMPAIAAPLLAPLGEAFAGTSIAGVPATTWANSALSAASAGHGLHHTFFEGIDGVGDAAFTTLELAPLGELIPTTLRFTNNSLKNIPHYYTKRPISKYTKPTDYILEQQLSSSQNQTIKDVFDNFVNKVSGKVQKTKKATEQARQDLLNELKSSWYKERVINNSGEVSMEEVENLLNTMQDRIKAVPIKYSKTRKQLSDTPGYGTNGTTVPRKPLISVNSDGTKVIDYNTGLNVNIASDLGESARSTGYHELQHYLTNNATGTTSYPHIQFYNNGAYNPVSYVDTEGNIIRMRGDGWQHYIMDQNDLLLPTKSYAHEKAVNEPKLLKRILTDTGKTSDEADTFIQMLRDEAEDMLNIQESRAWLKTWFNDEIKPLVKNPNDANEIEKILLEHPEIMENRPYKIKNLMDILRPGTIKDYSKYFAGALSAIPVTLNTKTEK